jgi:hypothetical protein
VRQDVKVPSAFSMTDQMSDVAADLGDARELGASLICALEARERRTLRR